MYERVEQFKKKFEQFKKKFGQFTKKFEQFEQFTTKWKVYERVEQFKKKIEQFGKKVEQLKASPTRSLLHNAAKNDEMIDGTHFAKKVF